MNSSSSQREPNREAALDRLVDGDLSEVERHELLLQIEADPDGWRRCALAFLEGQAWRQALGGPALSSSLPVLASPWPLPSASRSPSKLRKLSIAAALLLSFSAGIGAGQFPRSRPLVEVADRGASIPGPVAVAPPASPIHEVGSIDLVDPANGEAATTKLPIYSGPGLNDQWLLEQPPRVPDYVRAQWERRGYQVEERRKVVSVQLQDGRRVSIPVDEVEVGYVGHQPL